MARFELSNFKAGVNVANTIMWQMRTVATSRVRCFEIGLSVSVAPTTGPAWRLARSTAVGTSSATQAADLQESGTAAPTALLDTAWSVNPTLAANDLRKYATTSTIGSGIVWTWPDHRPLVIPVSAGVSIINANATGTTLGQFAIYIVFEE